MVCGKRSFNILNEDLDLNMARRYRAQFDMSYIRNNSSEDQATVKSSEEFRVFYHLLHRYLPNASRYDAEKSSSLKAHALKANFILPPFFTGLDSTDKLWYREQAHSKLVRIYVMFIFVFREMPWKFPLFASCPPFSTSTWTYTPNNDFSVRFRGLGLPLIISGVISKKSEQGCYLLLLQAIAVARLVFYPRSPDSTIRPFIVAIYLTASLRGERSIMMQKGQATNEVYISTKDFDLRDADEAIAFQHKMYNLVSVLEPIVDQLDKGKREELQAIKNKASEMKSLHSNGAWTNSTMARTMDSIPEEPESGYPNIALIMNNKTGEFVGCLKCVKDGRKEIDILQYLADLPSESNHTVLPISIRDVAGGSVIAISIAGDPLTSLNNLDAHPWSLLTQLFEAVHFMHEHNVVHLDLKPSNILIPSDYGHLTIIDFGVSVRLRHAAQLLQGRAGTKEYIAPEVGQTKFSPICADLWLTGKIVEELCMLCRPSAPCDWLLANSKQLLNDDPTKRPMVSEILQRMSSYVAVETLDGHHIRYLQPHLFWNLVEESFHIPSSPLVASGLASGCLA